MELFDDFQKFKTQLKAHVQQRPKSNIRNSILRPETSQKKLFHHRSSTLFNTQNSDRKKDTRFILLKQQLTDQIPIHE
ncbi:hypothetical protein pb186bvf_007356 [Paramecium bursaria]